MKTNYSFFSIYLLYNIYFNIELIVKLNKKANCYKHHISYENWWGMKAPAQPSCPAKKCPAGFLEFSIFFQVKY